MGFVVVLLQPDAALREQACTAFTAARWTVIEARDAREAFAEATNGDCVVFSARLTRPGEALQLVRRLRRTPRTKKVPIVVVADEGHEPHRFEGAGADVVVASAGQDVLVTAVRRAVALQQAGRPTLTRDSPRKA